MSASHDPGADWGEPRDEDETVDGAVRASDLRRLARRVFRYPRLIAAGMGCVLLGTFATLLEPRIFGYAIDRAILPRDASQLRFFALLLLAATCVRVAAMIAQTYLFEVLGQKVTQDLRMELFSHLQRLPIAVFDRNPAGKLLTRVTNDVASLAEMFSSGFVSMAGNFLMVAGIFVWLLALDLRLGLIAVSVLPIMLWACYRFSERLRVAYREARNRLSALNAFLAENIFGMRVIHLFNRQARHLDRFARINQWHADAQVGTVKVFAYFQPTITIFAGLSMALVIGFGARPGAVPLGVLATFFSYVLALFQPMREIADKWNMFLSGMASAERIFAILDWSPELSAREVVSPATRLPDLRGEIEFQNVWFAYGLPPGPGEGEPRWVIQDLSFKIAAGARVGIVGHTGSGKTTLISLLMRFYEPQRGRILIDGRDLREYDRRALRSAFGMIQQEVFLFSGSVEDNVTFWEKGGGESLFERGVNLSVGQRQLLAFDRALAAKPRVWILDEATANMDSGSESRLQALLAKYSEDGGGARTCLMIAHRLATIREADAILVLHRGVLAESGTHDELMARGGLYAKLQRFQEVESKSRALSQTV
jgi:ATP-binding cassette subfamily B protein